MAVRISNDEQRCVAQARVLLALTSRELLSRFAQVSGIPLSESADFPMQFLRGFGERRHSWLIFRRQSSLFFAVRSIEHTTYLPGCVRNEKGLKADRLAKRITGIDYFVAVVDGYDRNSAEAVFAQFASNHTWVTSTLASSHMSAYKDVERWDEDPPQVPYAAHASGL
jgi:hypothetical protein